MTEKIILFPSILIPSFPLPFVFSLIYSAISALQLRITTMHWDLILWLFSILSNIGLLVVLIYQIICLSDLEADYMNPYESAANINSVILPEFVLQGAFCALFLLTGHWVMFLITLPVAIYHARLFSRGEHLVDVTEIFRALSVEKKFRLIKLGVYLFFFFLVIVRLVIAIYNSLADEDDAVDGFWVS